MSASSWRNRNRGFQPGDGVHGDNKDHEQQLLLPPDESSTLVLNPNGDGLVLKKLFSRVIPRFLSPNVNNNIAEPVLQGVVTRITPSILGYLHSRRDGRNSIPKDSTGGLFSRLLSRSATTRGQEQPPMFHESERSMLLKAGLPTPPVGRWYSFESSSLAQLKDLAQRRDDCTKEVEGMDADSAVSLGKSSAFLLAHLGVLVFTDAKIQTCEHLKYLGLLLFCAIAFEAIFGLMAICGIGNASWKYARVREEVVELNHLMEEQMRQMEVVDVTDQCNQLAANRARFQRMFTSCKRIGKPLKFSLTFFYQLLTLLLTVSVIGITVNKGYNGWKNMC